MSKDQVKYLESERIKLWEAVTSIKEQQIQLSKSIEDISAEVATRTSDYTRDAKTASATVAQYRTKAKTYFSELSDTKNRINDLKDEAENLNSSLRAVSDLFESMREMYDKAETDYSQFAELESSTSEQFELVVTKLSEIESSLNEVNAFCEQSKETKDDIDSVRAEVENLYSKINTALSQSLKKKNKIDEIYDEIFGYIHKNEDGEDEEVDGLKHKLEESYSSIKKDLTSFDSELNSFKESKENEFVEFVKKSKTSVENLKSEIRQLLPEAMTAGLSHAYEKKRLAEEKVHESSSKSFKGAITGLVVVAILPVLVSVIFILEGLPFDRVLTDLPRIVFSFIPIYIPLLWFAIAANKRIKLAKRLIEEYAHKEVLSKTFEGLHSQIEKLEETNTTRDLRTRLLYNIISVSAENPGKLIKDFESTDNPMLEVLDKSLLFTNSLRKIGDIPGLAKILHAVEQKENFQKNKIDTDVATAIEANEMFDEKSEEK
jgi:uncharacterized coiled-coil DUF342 family protein